MAGPSQWPKWLRVLGRLRANCWWTCSVCGTVNQEIGDCKNCGA
jgi:hypothetical protein